MPNTYSEYAPTVHIAVVGESSCVAITSRHLDYFHMSHLVYHARGVFPSLLYLAAQSTLIVAAPSKDLGGGRGRRKGGERRKEEGEGGEGEGGGREGGEKEEREERREREERGRRNEGERRKEYGDINSNNLKAGMTKKSGAIL